ncbi:TrkH family potassium uptake protein [Aquibacillus koreensis]|uniref:TrkH family potassium uptake protein n=1 Tax=Aquibacillus koreensis TaxID=279446 RepID=A0A9X3WLL2_9BACI|nr:TrkH family potassium uptake protein [Aquibacillus koreensis]MCT2535219.1 TrkH family potassium uptake protein [Aquibacillus koreensis]MDC3421078.1 TrkH family potassium uptake protein [Aquibacillus koreensis]
MKRHRMVRLSPPQFLLVIFITCIIIGTVLLKLPIATTEGIGLLQALFTATSAMTVTGLAVVDTGTAFTIFGQLVILALIQVGGLGIMTFAVFIFLMVGRKIGFKERFIVSQALNQTSVGGIILLAKRLFIFSIIVEGIAFVALSFRWVPVHGIKEGLYASLFHSISSFNNAGFSIWQNGLIDYVGDPVINIVITMLFIIGGLGFTVIFDLWHKKDFHSLSVHTKLMLIGTFVINVLASIIIFILEYDNPNTIGNLSNSDKLLASYFQAVSPRTAGFNTVDIASMDESTLFFIVLLMFIGAGSASTGGGIKLTTFLALLFAVFAFIKNNQEIVIFRRAIVYSTIVRSLAITMISLGFVFLGIFILNITEDASFIEIVFETVSAFGTVGLSMGLTYELTPIGQIIIIMIMFIGKVGPLTLAFSFAHTTESKIRYPKEDLLTG